MAGQTEKALELFRKERQLAPDRHVFNVTRSLLRLNRFDEAEAEITQGMTRQPSTGSYRLYQAQLFQLAFAKGDTKQLNRLIAWFAAQPPDYEFETDLARVATATGRRAQAGEHFQKVAALTEARGLFDQQTGALCEEAATDLYFGRTGKAQAQTARALSLIRSNNADLRAHATGIVMRANPKPFVGWVLALSGDAAKATALADELLQKHPQDTMAKFLWRPLTLATIELQRGNPAQAIELLQPAIPYEAAPASSFRPNWIRGQAYLQLKQGAQAAAEFQKIIDHRGWDVTSPLWPLAHLGLARAALLQGDEVKAKQRYDEFFRLWKEADADLLVLTEAKKEYEKLR